MRKCTCLCSEHVLKVIFSDSYPAGNPIFRLEYLRPVDINLGMLLPACTAYKTRYALKAVGNKDLGLDISVASISDTYKYQFTP